MRLTGLPPDPDALRLAARLTRPGDVVVDAGANVGAIALECARRVGPGGHVHAFEPQRRLLPYLKLASDRERIPADDARRVESVVAKLADLVPDEPPSRLHGDLWNGNVLWGTEQRVWVIDPAAHGGHRETDLAMLALFGLPHLPRVVDAYAEVSPLAEGWQDRAGIHQLFPLLVHACLFGGGYGARAGAAAARYV